MTKLVDLISAEVSAAFAAAGFDAAYGKVTVSNRPDLCEFQCNGSLPAAKQYKAAPIKIAQAVAQALAGSEMFSSGGRLHAWVYQSEAVRRLPAGLPARDARLRPRFGLAPEAVPRKVVMDYGGPDVAKPLHVGHLRSAIIGESLKRIYRYFGNDVTGDIHMGDWGLQMADHCRAALPPAGAAVF